MVPTSLAVQKEQWDCSIIEWLKSMGMPYDDSKENLKNGSDRGKNAPHTKEERIKKYQKNWIIFVKTVW